MALKKKKVVLKRKTTHARILQEDKKLVENLVKKGFYKNTAMAIHCLINKSLKRK